MKRYISTGITALLLGLSSFAYAQQANVVATCGTIAYRAGDTRPLTQDTTGSQCSSATLSGSVTASTEYTEDAVAAVNPVGGVIIGVRRDTLTAAEVTADGDNVAIKATSKGQLHTALDDGASVTVGAKADAKSTATDTTAVTLMSVTKQISSSVQDSDPVAPVVSAAAESCHVLKAGAGTLYSVSTSIGATSGYVLVFNATSAPVDGAVTPVWFAPVASNGTNGFIAASWGGGPSLTMGTGITVCFSTTGPFTKTASATAAFSAQVK